MDADGIRFILLVILFGVAIPLGIGMTTVFILRCQEYKETGRFPGPIPYPSRRHGAPRNGPRGRR